MTSVRTARIEPAVDSVRYVPWSGVSLWNEKDALNLLAPHVVDESADEAFFGDPMRMHRDLLADAAKAYLDAHPIPR
jgi:hypothetical protein